MNSFEAMVSSSSRKRSYSAEKFAFYPEINVYDNKVMIASWREKLGIIIESAEIADAMKKIFELAWAEAKRLDAHGAGETGLTPARAAP